MPKGGGRKNNSGVKSPNPSVKKSEIFGALTIWVTFLVLFFGKANIPLLPLWAVLATVPLAVCVRRLILLPGETIGVDVVKKNVGTFIVYNMFWLLGAGGCWLSSTKAWASLIAGNPPVVVVPSAATNASGLALTPVDERERRLTASGSSVPPPGTSQPEASASSVVMLLPAGASDDIEVSEDGKPVITNKLDALRLQVLVPRKTTTHFIVRCSQFGTREFDYFPQFNGGEIEPFAS